MRPAMRVPPDMSDPLFGDAILDRLLNNTHAITLTVDSVRRLYGSTREANNDDD